MGIDERLKAVERKLKNLSRSHNTLYHRFYARLVRRSEIEQRVKRRLMEWAKAARIASRRVMAIGRLKHLARSGESVICLTEAEKARLRRLLKPRTSVGRRWSRKSKVSQLRRLPRSLSRQALKFPKKKTAKPADLKPGLLR